MLIQTQSILNIKTPCTLNVHETFWKRPGHLLTVLCIFNLRIVSREESNANNNFCSKKFNTRERYASVSTVNFRQVFAQQRCFHFHLCAGLTNWNCAFITKTKRLLFKITKWTILNNPPCLPKNYLTSNKAPSAVSPSGQHSCYPNANLCAKVNSRCWKLSFYVGLFVILSFKKLLLPY